MESRLYTIVSDFRGTTASHQVNATDAQQAVLEWAQLIRKSRGYGRASAYIAKTFQTKPWQAEPMAIGGQSNVWYTQATCGGDYIAVTIVATIPGDEGN